MQAPLHSLFVVVVGRNVVVAVRCTVVVVLAVVAGSCANILHCLVWWVVVGMWGWILVACVRVKYNIVASPWCGIWSRVGIAICILAFVCGSEVVPSAIQQ